MSRCKAGAGWFGRILVVMLAGSFAVQDGRADVKSVIWSPHSAHYGCRMNMGPTGARAWMRGYNFHVVTVDAGSPADGILETGDIVTGAGEKAFSEKADSRMTLGRAIGEAEASGGLLKLTVIRDGEEKQIEIRIPVMGAFAKGWPYGCAKSQRILNEACEYILEAQFPNGNVVSDGGIGTFHSGLLLLASGNPRYLDGARRAAYASAAMEIEKQETPNWGVAYISVLLSEYYLLTGDSTVLERLQGLIKYLEKGQMQCGSWGHTTPSAVYGALNQVGVIGGIALVLAQECGLEVDRTKLARTLSFFGKYAQLGAVPYGDHMPGVRIPDDNGKNSAAAVLFSMLPDRIDDSRVFAQSAAMSYWMREQGHTGGYFSMMWGPLAAQMAGQAAFSEFMGYQDWYYNLSKTWRGSLVMLPYFEALTRFDNATYNEFGGEFTTGGLGLTFALPHRKIRITGAPRSIFGANVSGVLKDAREAFQSRRWKDFDAAMVKAEKQVKTQDDKRWLAQLKSAKDMIDASTKIVVREIDNAFAEGDPYRASEQFAALKRCFGEEDAVIKELGPRFETGTAKWHIRSGARYYEAWEKLRAFNFQSWLPYGAPARELVGEVPPLRPAIWDTVVAVSPDISRDWQADGEAGLVSWSGDFTVSKPGLKALRLRFRAPRNSHSTVHINGAQVAEIMRGQRSGYAKILLYDSALSVLKEGSNVLKVTGTSVGSGDNALDAGLDGIMNEPEPAAGPAWVDTHNVVLPDADLAAVLAFARSTFAEQPVGAGSSEGVPERLRVKDSHDQFLAALQAGVDAMEAEVMLKALRSPVAYWRYLASRSLTGRGSEGLQIAVQGLQDRSWQMRSVSCDVVGSMAEQISDEQRPEITARLTRLLKDENAWVRCRAVNALGSIGQGGAEVVAALIKVSADEDVWVRAGAVGAVSRISTDPDVLIKAVCGALMIPETSFSVIGRSLPLIAQHGKDRKDVLKALVFALENPGEGGGSERLNNVMEMLAEIDPEGKTAVPAIARVAKGGYEYDRLKGRPRMRAIEILGGMESRAGAALPVLEAIVADSSDEKDASLREAAQTAIGRIKGNAE